MDPQTDGQPADGKELETEFEKTVAGDDFDFDFDEDFESEVQAEYTVMGAMRFDREAGTASCNFEIDDEEDDAFKIPENGRPEEPRKKGKSRK